MTFALASLLRPVDECRPSSGAELHRLLTELRPSLVLTEGYDEWMAVLSAHHNVPWVRYTTGPVAELSAGRPTEPAGLDPSLQGAEGIANAALLGLRRLRSGLGARRVRRAASRIGVTARPRPPAARVAFAAASLDDHANQPTTWSYLGLSPYHPPDRWWEATNSPERDTVLVTWGSGRVAGERELLGELLPVLVELSQRFRIVVQSADDGVRKLVEEQFSGGGRVDTQSPDRDPQYDLYQRACLVIGHGGYGTINEALAFGAPVLVLSELVADRMETARRVHGAGVGASLNRYTATTSSLRATIQRILEEPEIRRAVDRVGADLRDRSPSEQVLGQLRSLMR